MSIEFRLAYSLSLASMAVEQVRSERPKRTVRSSGDDGDRRRRALTATASCASQGLCAILAEDPVCPCRSCVIGAWGDLRAVGHKKIRNGRPRGDHIPNGTGHRDRVGATVCDSLVQIMSGRGADGSRNAAAAAGSALLIAFPLPSHQRT